MGAYWEPSGDSRYLARVSRTKRTAYSCMDDGAGDRGMSESGKSGLELEISLFFGFSFIHVSHSGQRAYLGGKVVVVWYCRNNGWQSRKVLDISRAPAVDS